MAKQLYQVPLNKRPNLLALDMDEIGALIEAAEYADGGEDQPINKLLRSAIRKLKGED
jgi:hypothetical protein